MYRQVDGVQHLMQPPREGWYNKVKHTTEGVVIQLSRATIIVIKRNHQEIVISSRWFITLALLRSSSGDPTPLGT